MTGFERSAGNPNDSFADVIAARLAEVEAARLAEEIALQQIMSPAEWEKWQRVKWLDFPPRWNWPDWPTNSILVELTPDELAKFRCVQGHSLTWLKYASTVGRLVVAMAVVYPIYYLPGDGWAGLPRVWFGLGTLLIVGTWIFGGFLAVRVIWQRIRK